MVTPRAKQNKQPKKRPKVEGHTGPFRVAGCWPHQEAPFILSMVGGTQTFIATSFSPIDFEELPDRTLASFDVSDIEPDLAKQLPQFLFVLPYNWTDHAIKGLGGTLTSWERPLAWKIYAGLIWDHGNNNPRYISRAGSEHARFHLTQNSQLNSILRDAKKWLPDEPIPLTIQSTISDDSYMFAVNRIIESIRNGEFYQVNFLRYFQCDQALGWQNLCTLMEQNSGPHGVMVTQGSRNLVSFSPERFVALEPAGQDFQISTWPIKGTSPRDYENAENDQSLGSSLSSNKKDRAELQMIIDLMRNDLAKICVQGSVHVADHGSLKQFKHVWHLQGEVSGIIKKEHKLRDLIMALCPGGSITGAPKVAAMARISADEGQSRGVFMGNFFRINCDGSMDSNILIRTLISDNWMKSAQYAAGSGIVIKSDADKERLEIEAKCRVITYSEAGS